MSHNNPQDPWGGRRCKATTAAGTLCRGFAVGGAEFCNFHDLQANDPDKFKDIQVKGGENSKRWYRKEELEERANVLLEEIINADVESPDDVRKLLVKTMKGVAAGVIDNQKATMVAYMSNVLLSAMRTDRQLPPPGSDIVVPEIKEIARSEDPRADQNNADYPGSELGKAN